MGERLRLFFRLLSAVFGWLLTAYMVYLFFLYLWSTFNYITPNGAFVLALLFTAIAVGYIAWRQFFTREGEG